MNWRYIILLFLLAAWLAWKAYLLFTGDWWQYREQRREEFRQASANDQWYVKLMNWIFDLLEGAL